MVVVVVVVVVGFELLNATNVIFFFPFHIFSNGFILGRSMTKWRGLWEKMTPGVLIYWFPLTFYITGGRSRIYCYI